MAKGRIRSTMSSLAQNWTMTQKVYKWLPLEVAGLFFGVGLVVGLPIALLLNPLTALLLAFPAGLLAATFWFSRRAMRAAYKQIEGQPGAAAAVIQSIRGGTWAVTPAVAVSKNQDIITRVVGRPGVVLVSEGPSTRVVVDARQRAQEDRPLAARRADLRDPGRATTRVRCRC